MAETITRSARFAADRLLRTVFPSYRRVRERLDMIAAFRTPVSSRF